MFPKARRAKANAGLGPGLKLYVHPNKHDVIYIIMTAAANSFSGILERLISKMKGNFIIRNVWCFH